MPASGAQAKDGNEFQVPEMRLVEPVIARDFNVDAPVEAAFVIVRRDVLQLGAIALAVGRLRGERERQLQAELPVVPQTVGIFRHGAQRSGAGLVDVRFQRVLAIAGELVGKDLDLVRRTERRQWNEKQGQTTFSHFHEHDTGARVAGSPASGKTWSVPDLV